MAKKDRFEVFVILVLTLLFAVAAPARADCLNPAASEGRIIFNGDQNVPQFCDGASWIALGTLNPSAGGSGCSDPEGVEGLIVYNGGIHRPQYCDGDDWREMVGFLDAPPFLTFADLADQSLSTQVTSGILGVNVAGSQAVGISGEGSPEYRICADAACGSVSQTWTSTSGAIDNGEFLQLRLTSANASATTRSATVTVGSASDNWDVTTYAVTSISFDSSATGSISVTGPASIVAGDILVLFDRAANNSGAPATALPSGFNQIANDLSASATVRSILSYKKATGSEASSSITGGMNGTLANSKILMVFRPNIVADTLTLGGVVNTVSDNNPATQTVTSAGGNAPLVVVAGYGATTVVGINPRTMTPAKDGEHNDSIYTYVAFKIYNSSPTNVDIDMDDEGSANQLIGAYISAQ